MESSPTTGTAAEFLTAFRKRILPGLMFIVIMAIVGIISSATALGFNNSMFAFGYSVTRATHGVVLGVLVPTLVAAAAGIWATQKGKHQIVRLFLLASVPCAVVFTALFISLLVLRFSDFQATSRNLWIDHLNTNPAKLCALQNDWGCAGFEAPCPTLCPKDCPFNPIPTSCYSVMKDKIRMPFGPIAAAGCLAIQLILMSIFMLNWHKQQHSVAEAPPCQPVE
eukprot:NODE_4321_length_807_cov_19.763235_g4163_i0.p1 GENE.NODE_4321_length_807_cov_19.763235_g4163_i0~~NODE_4321_length_807_cov_19.763235_g4163_i0.p1  ORF type:complete len:224 (-),score=33.59 NODE_4321_length_807_cov_19.763235_g4163_i0:80-751(-)